MYENLRKVAWVNLVLASVKLVVFVCTWSLVALYGSLHDFFDGANAILAIKLHRQGRERWTIIFNALLLLAGSLGVIGWSVYKLQTHVFFEPISWLLLLAGFFSLWGNSYNFFLIHGGQSRTESILSPHYLEDILDGFVLIVFGAASFWASLPSWWDPAAAITVAVIVAIFTVWRLFRMTKEADHHC